MLTHSPILLLEAFAWFWVGLGVLSGALIGLGFRRPGFLGGYDAWPRRMVRLGHIAFFGTGMLCLLMAGTLSRHMLPEGVRDVVVGGLMLGAVGMPAVCFASAALPRLTPMFAVPVLLIGASVTATYTHLLLAWLEVARA